MRAVDVIAVGMAQHQVSERPAGRVPFNSGVEFAAIEDVIGVEHKRAILAHHNRGVGEMSGGASIVGVCVLADLNNSVVWNFSPRRDAWHRTN